MKNNIIDFESASIKLKLNKFTKKGILDDSLYYKDGTEYYIDQSIKKHCDTDLIERIDRKLQTKRATDFIIHTNQFEKDLKLLQENFNTHHHSFKFPSILRQYRKGINPVTALYNELQKALFFYDPSDSYHTWVISLFKNDTWTQSLLIAIKTDILLIDEFTENHKDIGFKLYKSDLKTMYDVRKNLAHYYEVFSIMSEWDKDLS